MMTTNSLLTRLITPAEDEPRDSSAAISVKRDRWAGIVGDLHRLLNTRFVPTTDGQPKCLDYGLPASWQPDVAGANWQPELADAIRRAIERWEPRLEEVSVFPPEDNAARPIVFQLIAVFRAGSDVKVPIVAEIELSQGERLQILSFKEMK